MYALLLSKKVVKFIQFLPANQQKIILAKFEFLKIDPFHHPKLDIKKMKSRDEFYRLRIGKIRFIYEVNQKEVIILVFTGGFRGNAYKKN